MNLTSRAALHYVGGKIVGRIEEESKVWESEGRDSWAALRRLKACNLPIGDEIVIARNLHAALPKLKIALRKNGKGLGDFCLEAGLGTAGSYSKELHRMSIGPAQDPSLVRVRRSAAKYKRLIEEMANVLGSSPSSLANQLLLGTTLHPANAEMRDEVERVQSILQLIVDKVDQEYDLFGTFAATAELKARHAAEGGVCRWPHNEADWRVENYIERMRWANVEVLNGCQIRPIGDSRAEYDEMMPVAREAELRDATDVLRAYWEAPISRKAVQKQRPGTFPRFSGCRQDDEFFYIPHVYFAFVGVEFEDMVIDTTTVSRDEKLRQFGLDLAKSFKQIGAPISDEFCPARQQPFGQTNASDTSQYHAWIIVYPSPDNKILMPMLFIPGEEGGPTLIPLDSVTLSSLRNHYCFGVDGQHWTVFERMCDLIGFRSGHTQMIHEGLRRTAPWLKENPFLKLQKKNREDQEMMRAYCSALEG